MGPKVKITKEMILDAAFEVAREKGIDAINAKVVAARLHCSTQPVLYNFSAIRELKEAVCDRAWDYLNESIFSKVPKEGNPLREVGTAYVRMARNEPELVKALFQSGLEQKRSFEQISSRMGLQDIMPRFAAWMGIDGTEVQKEWAIRFFMIREDTKLFHFLLFCPKCKNERLINLEKFRIAQLSEPDAKTQSQSSI